MNVSPILSELFFRATKQLIERREGSLASIWGACVANTGASSPRSTAYTSVPPSNLHKTVSCHLLDQMYVSTSLPLLNPADLKRPDETGVAYTCGGPTVYSPFTWLGTNVTVRRPTPALSLPKENNPKGEDSSSPDQDACKSLIKELKVLRRLRHPAFLEVMAACHVSSPQPDHITLVFQHVPHGSLYHHLHVEHRDLSIGGAVDILVGTVEALLFLHAHGWLHAALSSHALHLISKNHAKLGAFEFAMEMHGKSCSMQAPQLLRATWLHPWQAPETLSEQMVSIRSEIYSLTAIMWEIWSGMPPWCGVEEAEIVKKVGSGETLPPVGGESQSLMTYLTQYGLKWNSHERELDLQEIHTMLRSLRIQSNEDDRVPAIPAWGPPSIPNTPVIGRHTLQNSSIPHAKTPSPEGFLHRRRSEPSCQKENPGSSAKHVDISCDYSGRSLEGKHIRKNNAIASCLTVVKDAHVGHRHPLVSVEGQQTYLKEDPEKIPVNHAKCADSRVIKSDLSVKEKMRVKAISMDSGFSTPCTRTPSPNIDTMTSAKNNSSFITSTPSRPPTTSVLRMDLQPDLLPNKVNVKALSGSQTPDILSRGPVELNRGMCKNKEGYVYDRGVGSLQGGMSPIFPATDSDAHSHISSPSDEEPILTFGYISNAAKRAFLMDSDVGEDVISTTPERPMSAARLERQELQTRASDSLRTSEIVKRGISMTNINSSPCFTTNTSVTRTTSHISLTSASSSSTSSDIIGKKPVRTVSQITLTLRKLSQVSDSSSSKDDLDEPQQEQQPRTRRSRSVPKSPVQTVRSSKKERGHGWDEITGIKPASHQLTRHSSSCSLASGPSSPIHQSSVSSSTWSPSKNRVNLSLGARASSNQNSPVHSPRESSTKNPVGRRWKSVSGTPGGLGDTAVKIQTRRHSEGQRTKTRKGKRRQEVEVEEEFFDDEFNALLFQQPHMQLSVGSSENLLDSRAPHSMLADGSASPVSLGLSSFSPSLTSSEDEDEEAESREGASKVVARARWRLGAVAEDCNSEEEDTDRNQDKKESNKSLENLPAHSENEVTSDNDDAFSGQWRVRDFNKEYEPLKSVQLLKNLEKNLSTYLPTHSYGSDTESG
ncbi:hypothetical protein SK128_012904 [Halocaridina rubra]|uniref:Protein kinase domain-containing protein n=1 Tax=Halocaridina rubra TaxID=373956 RepID=A0AAN8XR08_HALRR